MALAVLVPGQAKRIGLFRCLVRTVVSCILIELIIGLDAVNSDQFVLLCFRLIIAITDGNMDSYTCLILH